MLSRNIKVVFFVGVFLFLYISALSFVSAKDISFNPPVIKAVVDEGKSISSPIGLINSGPTKDIVIDHFPKDDFIFIPQGRFSLEEGDSLTVAIDLDSEGKSPGVYAGKIFISGDTEELSIPAILEVQTPSSHFDADINAFGAVLEALPGGKLVTEISVFKLRGDSDSVILEYLIQDQEGNVILTETQGLDVSRQLRFTKTFSLPEDIELGDYILSVKAQDVRLLSVGTSSSLFSIVPSLSPPIEVGNERNPLLIIGSVVIIAVLILSFILFNHLWDRRVVSTAKNWNKKLTGLKRIKFSDTAREIRRLKKKMSLLEHAYEKGYIKRDSYYEAKRKINPIIEGLKKRL